MSYTSYYYFIFLGAAFGLYTAIPKKYKWIVLLSASVVFYLINSRWLIIFLLLATVSVYFTGIFLNKINAGFALAKKGLEKEDRKKLKKNITWQKKAVVALSLIFIFGILLVLKYSGFFVSSVEFFARIFGFNPHFKTFNFLLPLGISYYTLQAAGYIIDVYRGKYRATDNFFKLALFLSFFPQIVEGPIGRYDLLADPLYEGHKFDYIRVTKGLQLIFWGLFKKIVIADRINIFVNEVFGNYQKYSGSIILLGSILYTLQIYADFSGCMDIVTGSAQLFGVPLSENFRRPFFSKSVAEFWRRWHITLCSWLRDYIFYPISLSKPFMKISKFAKAHTSNEYFSSLIPASFAMFFTWFGIGFWHGSGLKYIVYGLYYYVIMIIGMYMEPLFVRFFKAVRIDRNSKPVNALKIIRTLIFVVCGMTLFRADSIKVWFNMIKKVFVGFHGGTFLKDALSCGMDKQDFIIIIIGAAIMLIISVLQEKGLNIRDSLAKRALPVRWAVYACLILSIIIFGAYGVGYETVDFIYGQF